MFDIKIGLSPAYLAELAQKWRGAKMKNASRWSTPTSIRLPGPLLGDLDAAAERRGISRSELLQRILVDWLKAEGERPKAEQQGLGL